MGESFAVIATGGKQYLVRPGDRIRIEKLTGAPESRVTFDQVLLVVHGEKVDVGTPTVPGVTIEGVIVRQGRHKKVVGVKMKSKKRYRKKFGHRQHFTEVRIDTVPQA